MKFDHEAQPAGGTIVSIDPDREQVLRPRLAPSAMIVADNVLWSGRVSGAREGGRPSVDTEVLRAFNRSVLRDPGLAAAILPIGGGLLVATVRG